MIAEDAPVFEPCQGVLVTPLRSVHQRGSARATSRSASSSARDAGTWLGERCGILYVIGKGYRKRAAPLRRAARLARVVGRAAGDLRRRCPPGSPRIVAGCGMLRGTVTAVFGIRFAVPGRRPAPTPTVVQRSTDCVLMPSCGEVQLVNNSCRNRRCPLCQGLRQARRIESRLQRLLPTPLRARRIHGPRRTPQPHHPAKPPSRL